MNRRAWILLQVSAVAAGVWAALWLARVVSG